MWIVSPLRSLRRTWVEVTAAIGGALRGMAAHRMRAALSVLGVAIGVATLTAIVAIVQGLTVAFATQISALGANTLYVSSHPWVVRGDWWKYRNRPRLTHEDVRALREQATLLQAISPVASTAAEVSTLDERASNVQVRGVGDEYMETASLKLERGRFLSPIDVELGRPVVVVGSEVASALFRTADPVGARIRVGPRWFTIIGTLKAQGKAFGQSMDNNVTIPITLFENLFGQQRHQMIAATAPPAELDAAEDQIVEVLRRSRRLSAEKEDNFSVNRQSALVKMFTQETAVLFSVAIAVGLITLLVGGIGVMNIMLVAVTERTREIGVRRALGARKRTILVQFLLEAALVTMVGGAAGTAVGAFGARLIALVTPLSAVTPPTVIAAALLFSGVVGLLFGTWPAYRAARLDPIESLRYE